MQNMNTLQSSLTPEQIEDLREEWSIYSPMQKEVIVDEYLALEGKNMLGFSDFLVEKLNLKNSWKNRCLA
jgi:hypothetical protein